MDNINKYTVESIIDDIVTLEDRNTGFLLEFNRSDLPENIHEGSILMYDGTFKVLEEEEKEIRENLRERLERLKKLND